MKKIISLFAVTIASGILLTGCSDGGPSLELVKRVDVIKTIPTVTEKYGPFIFQENEEFLGGVAGIVLHFQNGDIEIQDDGTTVNFKPFQVK